MTVLILGTSVYHSRRLSAVLSIHHLEIIGGMHARCGILHDLTCHFTSALWMELLTHGDMPTTLAAGLDEPYHAADTGAEDVAPFVTLLG